MLAQEALPVEHCLCGTSLCGTGRIRDGNFAVCTCRTQYVCQRRQLRVVALGDGLPQSQAGRPSRAILALPGSERPAKMPTERSSCEEKPSCKGGWRPAENQERRRPQKSTGAPEDDTATSLERFHFTEKALTSPGSLSHRGARVRSARRLPQKKRGCSEAFGHEQFSGR